MGLTASLQIGRTALTAAQAALQVTGNNLANAATPGYHRQAATLVPVRGGIESEKAFFGRGVALQDINRQIDESLQARLRGAISDQEASNLEQSLLSQIESVLGELNEGDLSTQLSRFFNAFSELANNPNASETRSVIVEQGVTLASFMQRMRGSLVGLRDQVDAQLRTNVQQADDLLSRIAGLNKEIAVSEAGRAVNNSLRDQRDLLVDDLSKLIEVSTVEQPNGSLDVLIGSSPVVQGDTSRGLSVTFQSNGSSVDAIVQITDKLERVKPTSGSIGALLNQRQGTIQQTLTDLDAVASAVIFEVNDIHASGRPSEGLTTATATLSVPTAEQTLALNDPANQTLAGLPFAPRNGSFVVVVRDAATGAETRTTISVDLDGVDATGAPGFSNDTSLQDLQTALNAVGNLTATITSNGQLKIDAGAGFAFHFEDDTSGALASLGINTFFAGKDAADIAVRDEVIGNPGLVVAGAAPGANDAARKIAGLIDAPSKLAGGVSITEAWRRTSDRIAVASNGASTRAQAAGVVRASLDAQQLAISGVSVDEESINLITQQRQFQAAARFIASVDEMTQILLGLI